jgi:geranylgeranyl reductase family protein
MERAEVNGGERSFLLKLIVIQGDLLRIALFSMAQKYDVIVVGAGPAGSLASLILARAGKKVLMLDKASFPRLKVCGDCLNPRIWEIMDRHGLSDSLKELPHHVLEGVRIERDGETLLRRNFESLSRPFLAIDREKFDAWLAWEAMKAGVEFLHETRVQTVSFSGKVETSAGDFEAEWILGADGRNSIVARSAGLMAPLQECHRVGWQAQMEIDKLDHDLHLKIFSEGYCGLSRINEKYANLWMVLDSKVSGIPQKIANRFFPKLPALVWHSMTPVTRSAAVLGRGSVWLIGDSARVVEPFTSEGITLALVSAEVAARSILSVHRPEEKGVALLNYQREHDLLCRSRIQSGIFLRWLMQNPSRAYRWSGLIRYFPGPMSRVINRVIGVE